MSKLTVQQRSLVKNLIKGMTITEAALAAGYSENCPAQSGSQALENIRLKMPEVLEKAGLTDQVLIENYLKPALQASETEFAKFEGRITDEREVIAWGPRIQALDMTFNLKGSYAPKASSGSQTAVAVNVVVEHIGSRTQNSASAQTE